MTLANIVRQKLNEWQPAAGRQELVITADDASMTLIADRKEELGCLVWELGVHRQAPQAETLRSWAERIAQRVTGLIDPLKVLEIDDPGNEGLLRSDSPQVHGAQVTYFEILLKGTSFAALRRYQAGHGLGGRRSQIAFALTHEAIAKLAGDLAASQ